MTTVKMTTSHSHPAITGKPLLWLRTEGLIELLAMLLLFHTTHLSWWLVVLIRAGGVRHGGSGLRSVWDRSG